MGSYTIRAAAGACLLCSSVSAVAVPLATGYNIDVVGLIDAEHTRSTDNYRDSQIWSFNGAGQAIGTARRYDAAGALIGQSAWLHSAGINTNIGLTDAAHTGLNGYRSSFAGVLNATGQVAGYSARYDASGNDIGIDAWSYNGSSTTVIGLADAAHTRSTDAYRYNYAQYIGTTGQVAGYSYRYSSTGVDNGQSAWLYSGGHTTNIGLIDNDHTGTDSYRHSAIVNSNAAGQVAGNASRFRSDGTQNGQSAWLHSGGTTRNIGLLDQEHSPGNGYRYSEVKFLNGAGQAAGVAYRYLWNGMSTGHSAWLYNGITSVKIGLTDAEHTDSDASGFQSNLISALNDSGQAIGTATRYSATGAATGRSAWLYSNGLTHNIGLRDAAHTRVDGWRISDVQRLNNAGQAVGSSVRYNNSNMGSYGSDVWLYSNGQTTVIGLSDAEHTRSTNGWRTNSAIDLNEAGQVLGLADRYDASGTANGRSPWLFSAGNTIRLGLTDARHTGANGFRDGYAPYLNEAGQVAGYSYIYSETGVKVGQTAWLFDPTLGQTFAFDLSIAANGASYSQISYLGDDGLALGVYKLYENDTFVGARAFAFTLEDGVVDFGGLFAEDELTIAGWDYLASAYRANPAGQILGYGLLNDMTTGQVGFLLTPQVSAVPLPGAVWLFGSGLVGLIALAKRKTAHSPLSIHNT